MIRRLIFFSLLLAVMPLSSMAYDFSAVSPSGHTLYYDIVFGGVWVTQPNVGEPYWDEGTKPSGELVIPASVTYNGATYAVTDIAYYSFYDCDSLTSVTIPHSVARIRDFAFCGCTRLTSLTLPDTMDYIGEDAFAGCSGLITVSVPQCNSIGDGAFYNVYHIEYHGNAGGAPWGAKYMNTRDGDFIHSNTTKDTLVRYIGSGGSVTIPSTVRVILDEVFYRNSTVTEITIPSQVEQIGIAPEPEWDAPQAFRACAALTTVNFNAVNCRNAAIERGPFRDCPLLTTLNIGEGVTLIDYAMFEGCRALSSLVIPNSVSRIGAFAFEDCIGIPSIHIPRSVTEIEAEAFWYCRFSSMSVDSENPVYDSRDNCNAIIETATNTLVHGCANTVIPNTISRIGVVAFVFCSDLTAIAFPESVRVIGEGAFNECTGLASVAMGNAIDSIEDGAFDGCSSLTSITIPSSVTYVGRRAFNGCSGLDTLHFNAVDCQMHVFLEDDGEGGSWKFPMFGGCGEFVLTIGEDVTRIPDMMFYDDTVRRWDYDNNTRIEGTSFALTAIVSRATVPPVVGRDAFYLTDRRIPLTVPCGAEVAYRADSAWSEFTNIQCTDEAGIGEVAEADDVRVWSSGGRIHIGVQASLPVEARVYDMMGRRVATTVAVGNDASVAVPAGVYLVKVGTLPGRKVVVM
ncbi:MAG: leucine-rich repeat domain-containing protein [Bacteroidales bacterium]|nr:leucine-rich repeat domain-containing protein [Bacteroidales bacterium]